MRRPWPACNRAATWPQSHLRLVLKNGPIAADPKNHVTATPIDIQGSVGAAPAQAAPTPQGMRLDSVRRGEVLRVVSVDGDDAISERLAACGVWAGVELECLASAPFGGPMLFRIHGYRLALRRTEAARVVVASGSDSGAVA